jgi:hypothetical protein
MAHQPFRSLCLFEHHFPPVLSLLHKVLLSVLFVLLLCPLARADVTIEFVLDGSGSMWSQMYEQYKIVILKEGTAKFLENAPAGIRLGVRAFGLPGGEGCSNTKLLVQPALNAEQEALRAVKRMNPTGQAPLIFSLRKGLKDLEGIEGKKVLILIADGSDSCEKDIPAAIEKLSLAISTEEIHVIGLGVKEDQERSDLKLLAAKANGSFSTASNRTQLEQRIQRIVSNAIKEEERRLRLLAEEQARMASMADKTRLMVEFVSDVPGFFCTGIKLLELKVDGDVVEGIQDKDVSCSEQIRIFDQPVSRGEHTVSLTYSKDNHGDMVRSRPESFDVLVESGKATRLECRTSGHLFYWGLDSEVVVGAAP